MLAVAPEARTSSPPSSPSSSRSRTPPAAVTIASEDLFSIDLEEDEAGGAVEKAAARQNAREVSAKRTRTTDDVFADDADATDGVPQAAAPSTAPREAAAPPREPLAGVDSTESAGAEERKAQSGEAASASSSLSLPMTPTTSKTPDASPLPSSLVLDLDDSECCVCLDEFDEGDNPAAFTKCGHRFHLQCCMSWAQRSSACPLCGARLEMEDEGLNELLPPPPPPPTPRFQELRVGGGGAASSSVPTAAAAFRRVSPLVLLPSSSWDPSRRNSRLGGASNSSTSSSSRRGGASALSSPLSENASSPLPSPSPSSSSFRARWAALGAKMAAAVIGSSNGGATGATGTAAAKAPPAASLEQRQRRRH